MSIGFSDMQILAVSFAYDFLPQMVGSKLYNPVESALCREKKI